MDVCSQATYSTTKNAQKEYTFCNLLSLLNIMFYHSNTFILKTVLEGIGHYVLNHSSLGGHLVCLPVFAITSCMARSTTVCVCVFPGHTSQNGIAGSQAVHIFNFIKYCQIALQNDCTKLHSLQQTVRVFISLHSCQCSVFSNFMFASLIRVK